MNVVFLYTELADYFVACCNELASSANVHIIRWPVNREAPFRFSFSPEIKVYDKNASSRAQLSQLIDGIKPDIIICSGWIDKDYLRLVEPWFRKIPTVITCDTHWRGDLRQRAATVLSRFILKKRFSHIWVPGSPQYRYALKLGFRPAQIRQHFYCCDIQRFNGIFERSFPDKEKSFPKVFLYAGRYHEFKGVAELWQAFRELCEEQDHGWELWCLGTGTVEGLKHPRIRHFGFVQPENLEPVLAKAGVFILPSRFEPWGVVVQEYAASGFPLMLSKEVGAAEMFLIEADNGYVFEKENVSALKEVMKKVISLNGDLLSAMGRKSHQMAQKIRPSLWAQTIKELVHEHSQK